jgi:hypothetical protein
MMSIKKASNSKVFILIVFVVLTILLLVVVSVKKEDYTVLVFNLDDYKNEQIMFSTNYSGDAIDCAETAVKTAEKFWEAEFGYVTGKYKNPNPGKSVQVYYDASTNCWLITGTLPRGETNKDIAACYHLPKILIQEDGTVLALWMG